MAETPEVNVVQISRDDKGFGGGSEGANAVCTPAVDAAFFDATRVHPQNPTDSRVCDDAAERLEFLRGRPYSANWKMRI